MISTLYMLWHTSQDGTLCNTMLTPSFSLLLTSTPDTPKQGKSIKSININSLHSLKCYMFINILYINLLQTFELHMQPLPQFYQQYIYIYIYIYVCVCVCACACICVCMCVCVCVRARAFVSTILLDKYCKT